MSKKKLLCLLMAAIIITGLWPLTALAADAPGMADFLGADFAVFGTSAVSTAGVGGVLLEFNGDQQGEIKLSDIKDIAFSVNGVATAVELREIEKYPYVEHSSTIREGSTFPALIKMCAYRRNP